MVIQLEFPFRMLIAGPSASGKSYFVAELIRERAKMISKPIEHIVYCAKFRTSIPENMEMDESFTFHQGLPNDEMFENRDLGNVLYILDDLLDVAFKSEIVSNMFCEGRHRR